MYRLMGGVLILMSTTGAGILYGRELQTYLENLQTIRELLYLIKGEIEYAGIPLGEIFARTARKVEEPYKGWLMDMQHRMEGRRDISFLKMWTHAIDRNLAELHLKKTHLRMLKELGVSLGQNDRASEAKHFTLHLERLEREIEELREDIKAKKRIGSCLGIMSGMFLIIVLI